MLVPLSALWCAFALCLTSDPLARVDPPTTAAPGAPATALSAVDWSAIRAAHDAHRHAAVEIGDGFAARNPGQQWVTRFDGRGFTVTPDHGAWTWGLELERFGFADAQESVSTTAAACARAERVEYDWSPMLTEWCSNLASGLEHGFTVHQRPQGKDGALTLSLRIRGALSPRVTDHGRGVIFVDESGEQALTYSGLVAADASGRQLPARIESDAGRLSLIVDERGARYPITIDPIVQQQAYLKASNTDSGDMFGFDVAISGDTAVVAASGERSNATGVNGNEADNSLLGAGAAYVFVRSGTTWSQQAYLKASNTDASDGFGGSVSIDGDTIVVGAAGEDSNSPGVNGNQADNSINSAGAAYVFVRSGTTWSQQAYLKASNPDGGPTPASGGDDFGCDVAISGDTIVVGARFEDSNSTGVNGAQGNVSQFYDAGAAYVFVRSGTTWSQEAYLKASNTSSGDHFGRSVSISGDTAVIGAAEEDSNATGVDGDGANNSAADSGAAYVFVRSGTTWSQQAYLKASNTNANDRFGQDVSISGDTVVVGAYIESSNATGVNGNQADNSANASGAAYVFVRNGTTWSQQAYLKASNSEASDTFGSHVAVSGDVVVVGSTPESSNATGVNGNQSDNSMSGAGAAYVFWRNGVAWSQQAYLKASNTGAHDAFGWSLAVSSNTVLAGAMFEDSNATGVNGNQNDNSLVDAGAAYAFVFEPPTYSYYCSGDGSLATPCPCSLPDTVPSPPAAFGHGCANSLDLNGALLSATGTTSPDTLTIRVDVAPAYAGFAFLVKGNATNNNGIAASDGVRCIDGALIRFGSHNAGTNGNPSGQWIYPNTAQTTAISTLTLQPPAQSAYYQLFYRNAAASFCTSATANWSNGLAVAWP